MCLISLAFDNHPDYALLLAANRDEYYRRPTAPAQFWAEAPQVLAGRDLQAGGTWMGITADGRLAAVTNHRNPTSTPDAPRSRGFLTLEFLTGGLGAMDYLEALDQESGQYAGFNLLLMDASGLYYYSNIARDIRSLPAGVYSVSNGLLDSGWPKQRVASEALQALIPGPVDHEALQGTVNGVETAAEEDLPETGLDHDLELALSSRFIITPEYGTRAMTTLAMRRDGHVDFMEQSYTEGGLRNGRRRHAFHIQAVS